jgi:hypothetical protein
VLVEPDAGAGLGQDHFQCRFAALQRITAQVVAVQLDQIESVEEDALTADSPLRRSHARIIRIIAGLRRPAPTVN